MTRNLLALALVALGALLVAALAGGPRAALAQPAPTPTPPPPDAQGNPRLLPGVTAEGGRTYRLGYLDWLLDVPAGMRLRVDIAPTPPGGVSRIGLVDVASGSRLVLDGATLRETNRVPSGTPEQRATAAAGFDSVVRSFRPSPGGQLSAPAPVVLSGVVWEDLDADGVREADEPTAQLPRPLMMYAYNQQIYPNSGSATGGTSTAVCPRDAGPSCRHAASGSWSAPGTTRGARADRSTWSSPRRARNSTSACCMYHGCRASTGRRPATRSTPHRGWRPS